MRRRAILALLLAIVFVPADAGRAMAKFVSAAGPQFLMFRTILIANPPSTLVATAQVNTLRLKLLKIGARIRETSRRIWVHLASGYPYRDLLVLVLQNLRASPG